MGVEEHNMSSPCSRVLQEIGKKEFTTVRVDHRCPTISHPTKVQRGTKEDYSVTLSLNASEMVEKTFCYDLKACITICSIISSHQHNYHTTMIEKATSISLLQLQLQLQRDPEYGTSNTFITMSRSLQQASWKPT